MSGLVGVTQWDLLVVVAVGDGFGAGLYELVHMLRLESAVASRANAMAFDQSFLAHRLTELG